MNYLLNEEVIQSGCATTALRFCGVVLVSALTMPLPTQAVPLEVQGIHTDLQLQIQVPAGCGKIRSWHGQIQDMDGVMRSSVHRGLDVVALAGTPIRATAPGQVIYREKQWAGGNNLLISPPSASTTFITRYPSNRVNWQVVNFYPGRADATMAIVRAFLQVLPFRLSVDSAQQPPETLLS